MGRQRHAWTGQLEVWKETSTSRCHVVVTRCNTQSSKAVNRYWLVAFSTPTLQCCMLPPSLVSRIPYVFAAYPVEYGQPQPAYHNHHNHNDNVLTTTTAITPFPSPPTYPPPFSPACVSVIVKYQMADHPCGDI